MKAILRLVLLSCVLLGRAQAEEPAVPTNTPHDWWLLTMSWSPQYCNANVGSKEPQCQFEHYFVVRGLRPQFDSGERAGCGKPKKLAEDVIGRLIDVTHNRAVALQEWRRHGICSGLDPSEYAIQMDYARRRVQIPEAYVGVTATLTTTLADFKKAFMQSNPELPEDGFVASCSGRWLKEVSFCFDKEFKFRQCTLGVESRCTADALKLRRIRSNRVDRFEDE